MESGNFQNYLFPAYFGFFAFYDAGKLWADETSTGWLNGYGGGVWIAPLAGSC
jgi:hypothetical protein